MGQASDIINGFISHWLSMEIAVKMKRREAWISSHSEGGKAHNAECIAEYRHRIKHL